MDFSTYDGSFIDIVIDLDGGEHHDGGTIKCPSCGKFVELEWQDYVELPMIWGWDCSCENKMFLTFDPDEMAKAEGFEFRDFSPEFRYLEYLNSQPERIVTIRARFLFIERVISNRFTMISATREPTIDEITQISEGYPGGGRIDGEELQEYLDTQCAGLGLTLLDDQYVCGLHDTEYAIDKGYETYSSIYSSHYNLSLPCNSYSTERPEVPYPKNYTLNHDGSQVMALLRDYPTVGEKRWVFYSGD